jgi:hypothetical protein
MHAIEKEITMHKTNVNTESAKRNSASAKILQALQKSAESMPTFISSPIRQFDDDAMGERDHLRGIAGRGLNKSFDTIYAIGGLVTHLRANKDEEGHFFRSFNVNTEAQILTGIAVMSEALNEVLSDIAYTFHQETKVAA